MKNKLKPFIFPLVLLLLVAVLTTFKIHGSSIGVYNQYFYGNSYSDPDLLYGQPRGIRSDEWLVLTPWTASESQIHYASDNTIYLAGQNLVMTDVPIANWTIAFKPQNWGFLVLPVEYAFSLKWWIRTLLLIVAGYLFLMELTNQNILASVIGALAFWLAPYFQWWYATPALEVVFFGIFTFLFFLRTFRSGNKLSLAINTLCFIYFSICFALLFYPPFQIPTALFFGLIGIGFVVDRRSELTPARIRSLAMAAAVAVLAIGMILAAYYLMFKDIINVMQHTVYPGSRRATGGQLPLLYLLTAFFNIQLLDDYKQVPEFMLNQSEAAGFFMFSLFLLPVFLFRLIKSVLLKEKLDLILLFAVVFELLALSWAVFGLPTILGKVLMFEYVPGRRLRLVLGLVNFFLIIYYLYQFKFEPTPRFKIVAGLLSLGVFLIILRTGLYLRGGWPTFIQSGLKIFLIAAIAGVLTILLLFRQRVAFLILFLAFSLVTTYRVNPLYRGLDVLLSSDLSMNIKRIRDHDQDGIWVVYDSLVLANYLAANGVHVVNGTYYYPNLEFWRKFDPDGFYVDIYNRYSHVLFRSADGEAASFTLVHADVFSVNVNPCSAIMRNLDVDYYVFTQQVSYPCLFLLNVVDFPNSPIYIYRRSD